MQWISQGLGWDGGQDVLNWTLKKMNAQITNAQQSGKWPAP